MKTFALFGAGRIGRIHAANIAAHGAARLKYVVDVDGDAARRIAEPAGAAVADAATALADAAVDALLVASPTDTHASLIEAGAAAGKAVLCEKPVDLDVARARRAVAAAERAGVLLAIGFNRRYDPSFRRIRAGIDAGEIGAVETVLIVSRDPSPPPVAYVERSGGMFRDMTIHDLDMARWLLGEEPVEVTAHGSCLVDPGIGAAGDIDTAAVTLRTAGGRIAQVANSRRAAFGYDQRIEVCGAKGMFAAGNRRATSVEHATSAGYARDPALPFFLERYADAYRLELDAFVRRLHGEPADLVSGGDGVRALEIAEACDRSLHSRATVELEARA
jgi:myo-inositol 2-dehydrogenase/D-chiro-inositol 1-dehydrogenase